jgi:hypothetical protein
VLYESSCATWRTALARVGDALARVDVPADVGAVLVDIDAVPPGYRGSPTILIGGVDPFPGEPAPFGACRLYATDSGLDGVPSVAQLIDAISSGVVE